VIRRRWLDDRAYADLVALCQFLGPASSQVGIAIGLSRAGYPGGLLCPRQRRVPLALYVADAALARGRPERGCRGSQGAPLAVWRQVADSWASMSALGHFAT